MDSGSIVPADPVDCPKGQVVYDTVVETAGCSAASDTLECLRALPYEQFLNAANAVPGFIGYQSVALSYGKLYFGLFYFFSCAPFEEQDVGSLA